MFSRVFFSLLFFLGCCPVLFADVDSPQRATFGQPAVMLGIAIVFFYFILWRPEQKRRQAMEKRKSELVIGDKVTAMGIVGTIAEIREHTVILNIASGKIEILKAAISEILKAEK